MLILSVEASTRIASIALANDNNIIGTFSSDNPKAHSEVLNQAIDDILKKNNLELSQIDLYAVSVGPGSFTGVRVALNMIRTFAFLFKKPIFSTNSLEILKNNEKNKDFKNAFCMINAYKNMVYLSCYLNDKLVLSPVAIQVTEFNSVFDRIKNENSMINTNFFCFGDGYLAYQNIFSKTEGLCYTENLENHFPLASTLAKMAFASEKIIEKKDRTLDWKLTIPLYLRASAAEEMIKE